MRLITVLLVGLGLTAFSPQALAQPSPAVPAAPAAGVQKAAARAPAFEYLGSLHADIGTRTVIDGGPQGTRTVVELVGGRFDGPRLKASLQPPAADWVTNRADGSLKLDVRFTLKTDDGALILVTYNGIGQPTEAGVSLRSAPLFETGDARYLWLTRLQAFGVGERVGTAITYDIYALK